MVPRAAYAVVWCVPGLSRMHCTLATGAIVAKEAGLRYALTAFPARWHRLVREAQRIRCRGGRRSLFRQPLSRRRGLIGFWDMLDDCPAAGGPETAGPADGRASGEVAGSGEAARRRVGW